MECPSCKLINPPEAKRCDCGYDFETQTAPSPSQGRLEPIRLFSKAALKAGWFLFLRTGTVFLGLFLVFVPGIILLGEPLLWIGLVVAAAGSSYAIQRVTKAWAIAQYGRVPEGFLWWGVIWRAGLINGPLQRMATVIEEKLTEDLGELGVLIFVVIEVPLFIFGLYTSGWAMSGIVRKKLLGSGRPAQKLRGSALEKHVKEEEERQS